jgi:hypothetical protein
MSTTNAISISDWRILLIMGSVFLFVVMGCGERTCFEPCTPLAEVTLTWPPDHSVIEDTVSVCAAVPDSGMVSRIQFFADGLLLHEDRTPPYAFEWAADSYPLGSTHRLWARAFDAGCHYVSSETLTVHCQWLAILEDDDDPWIGDLKRVYVRSSATLIEFRIELDCPSEDCIREYDHWVLLDTDQNEATGCSTTGNLFDLAPNDIGVDFAAFCGALWAWGHSGCDGVDGFPMILPSFAFVDPNIIKLGINLADIGNPAAIDIVVTAYATCRSCTQYANDSAPDSGHATYVIDGLYLGN